MTDLTNLFELLSTEGYEILKTKPLGGKIPDILALKSELVAYDQKEKASEIPTAIGQCLHYLNECDKVYIVLPINEVEKLSLDTKETLKRYGIGLIGKGKELKIIFDANKQNFAKRKSIFEILNQSEVSQIVHKKTNLKSRISDLLKRNPKGLTILEISNSLNENRNTVTKYIYELSGSGKIQQRRIGSAKLCVLVKNTKRGYKK